MSLIFTSKTHWFYNLIFFFPLVLKPAAAVLNKLEGQRNWCWVNINRKTLTHPPFYSQFLRMRIQVLFHFSLSYPAALRFQTHQDLHCSTQLTHTITAPSFLTLYSVYFCFFPPSQTFSSVSKFASRFSQHSRKICRTQRDKRVRSLGPVRVHLGWEIFFKEYDCLGKWWFITPSSCF